MLRRLGVLLLLLSSVCLGQSFSGPVGLVYGPGGGLYLAERGRSRVIRVDGRVLADGVEAWGLVLIGDEIACSEPTKGRILWLGSEGPSQLLGGLDRPTGMAWNAETRLLYVVERSGRLLEVDPFSGQIKRVVTDDLPGAEGVCCTNLKAYVTLPSLDQVRSVDLGDGTVTTLAEDVELPTGIAVGRGVVYVASGETGQVVELELDHPDRRRVLAELGVPGLSGLVTAVENTSTGLRLGPISVGVGPMPPDPVTQLPQADAPPLPGKLTLTVANLVDGSLSTVRLSDDPHPRALVPPSLSPAGSLRYELESRLFASGLTQAELNPAGKAVHAPLLRSLYASGEPALGIVDSALDAEGNVYYSLTLGGRVVTGWGNNLRVLAEGLQDPAGLAVDNQGVVFVAEAGAGRVSTLLPGGEVLPVATDLGRPVDLALLPGAGIAVVDEAGGQLVLLGSEGARVLRSDLRQPVAITRLPDGDLAVVEAGADRVVRLAPDGTLRKVLFTSAPGELVPPRMGWRVLGGLAADPLSGLLYIAVPGRSRWVSVSY